MGPNCRYPMVLGEHPLLPGSRQRHPSTGADLSAEAPSEQAGHSFRGVCISAACVRNLQAKPGKIHHDCIVALSHYVNKLSKRNGAHFLAIAVASKNSTLGATTPLIRQTSRLLFCYTRRNGYKAQRMIPQPHNLFYVGSRAYACACLPPASRSG